MPDATEPTRATVDEVTNRDGHTVRVAVEDHPDHRTILVGEPGRDPFEFAEPEARRLGSAITDSTKPDHR